MREIIVGVSTAVDAGLHAVRWAARRASMRGARLHIVHVIDLAVETTRDADLMAAAKAEAQGAIDAAIAIAIEVDPDLEVVTTFEHGPATEVFDELSRNAELLVVGSDWHGGKRPSRRGVHSLRIAAGSHVPVAVIPDIDVTGRRGVVVGVDGSASSATTLEFAASEAERLGEPLIAVHAWDLGVIVGAEYGYGVSMVDDGDLSSAARELLETALQPVVAAHPELEIDQRVVVGDPVVALSDAADEASLLVVGSHGRGALARFLLGSVSHGILAHLEGPTVVVR
ncbi:universal stress protein [Agromyces sp. SYSU K20354]|uniref:universal stress protein n=1 Tax=Agromyces cavernae TaxID=2898659 RepID=UPI001E6412AC|nr:universal stress protein [Agromyces cavernae]MCD2444217.1 universal stress protein [Agromyces cavernae]